MNEKTHEIEVIRQDVTRIPKDTRHTAKFGSDRQ
jgi:hypothetical protein